MKTRKLIFGKLLAIGFFAMTSAMVSCDDDDEPTALSLSTITAGSIDLNAATSANNVPVDSDITATFSTDVDATTAIADNIKLVRDYDDANLPITLTASGNTITISPDESLGQGSLYILTFGTGLKSTGGKFLTEVVERNFTTEGTFAPAGVVAHFAFEDSPEDVVADFDPTAADVVDVTYVTSRNAAAGKAASFNGTTSLIEVPNADQFMANQDFGISFWVKPTFTEGKGQFVMGLGAWKGLQFEIPDDWSWVKFAMQYDQGDGTTDSEDSFYSGNGETKDNGGWQGWTFNKDVTASGGVGDTYFKDKWAHVVMSYNSATKVNTMYINGEKVKEHNFNLWPADAKKKNVVGVKYAGNPAPGNEMAFGFIQARENRIITDTWADYADTNNKHFKGLLDDVRIFSVPLTQTEVTLMYNSEKP